MCLSQTPTGVFAGSMVHYCPHLPPALACFCAPLPGAGPFVCPVPCGRPCALEAAHDNAPPPEALGSGEHFLSLRLGLTLTALVAASAAYPADGRGTETRPHPRPGELTLAGRRRMGAN